MDAERFAALATSFAANASEQEAVNAGRLMIREAHKDGVRLIDLFYRADVLAALDATIKPVRETPLDVTALQEENEDLRAKLAQVVPEVTRLAGVLTNERKEVVEIAAWAVGLGAVILLALWKFGIAGAGVAYVVSNLILLVSCKD